MPAQYTCLLDKDKYSCDGYQHQCPNCGFEVHEARRRSVLIKNNGLTRSGDGLWYLDISHNEITREETHP